MTKIHEMVLKKRLGYRFTTNDFITFESNIEKSLIEVYDLKGNKVVIDTSKESAFMLMEFFRYINEDIGE